MSTQLHNLDFSFFPRSFILLPRTGRISMKCTLSLALFGLIQRKTEVDLAGRTTQQPQTLGPMKNKLLLRATKKSDEILRED
mmetsp:Transcript_14205/g.25001  ORF Transcript_14205/g.25001 Transcript_14205/m.25001 type:complete len:82 (+) Transcript_14205:357-602(+)